MLKLQTLTILLFSSFALLSCSDQHDASRWELKEFDFDWRLDWPITIVTDAVAQDCSEDCLAGTVSEALGDICYYRFYDLCHTTQIEAAIERMEASGLDYIVSPRAPFDWENNVSTPGQWPSPFSVDRERCSETSCSEGDVCDYYSGICHSEDQTSCSRVCGLIEQCYEGVEQCEQKCELMMAGPCLGGACPLSESAVVEYVSGVEGLGCDVVKSWDALRLFPKTMGPQPSQRVSHPPAVDCSPLQKAAMLQRIGFLEVASTPEAVERYNECAGFQGSCTEQLHCLKMRRLIDDDV